MWFIFYIIFIGLKINMKICIWFLIGKLIEIIFRNDNVYFFYWIMFILVVYGFDNLNIWNLYLKFLMDVF